MFFLIDPTIKIPSTKIIPPQNQEWLKLALKKENVIPGLPKDVQGLIADVSDWHFPFSDALKYREELMEERKYFIKQNNEERFERPFSLCEH